MYIFNTHTSLTMCVWELIVLGFLGISISLMLSSHCSYYQRRRLVISYRTDVNDVLSD